MTKAMQKRVVLLLLLTFSLLLTSCGFKPEAGETPLESEAAIRMSRTGTQGLEMRFLQDLPPRTLYDSTEFVAVAEIWNKGGHDIQLGGCFVELTGFDPNIMQGMVSRQACSPQLLEGKKPYNLDGVFEQVEFLSPTIKLPFGVHDYNPNLNLIACYEYQTIASPLVCVENSLYTISSEQKSCIVQDVSTGGGQAAPVGVSYVDVEMAGNRAVFAISVNNYGTGRVLSPDSSLSSCPATLQYNDFDKVDYSVRLSGGGVGDCKPRDGLVRMTNDQGKIVCTFDIGNSPSYETPLLINLNYNYMESFRQPINIIKTPGLE